MCQGLLVIMLTSADIAALNSVVLIYLINVLNVQYVRIGQFMLKTNSGQHITSQE